MQVFQLKRAYDQPDEGDGMRYLIDRLWPRGLTKASLKIEGWLRDVAPSKALRNWFKHDAAKWNEFRTRYFGELEAKPESWMPLIEAARKGTVTLIYSARDAEHNNAVALAEYLRTQQSKIDSKHRR